MDKRLRQAIDSNLSGLRVQETHRLAILKAIEGGEPVKKKMSLALAVALCILLLTAVAFAAVILGGKDVVDQMIAPLGQETDSNRFTKEEVEKVLAFAGEHGILLDDGVLRRIREEGSYFKEELAMLFAKEQLGFYPGTWDVADQHWFGEFWHSIDPDIINFNTIPGEGELPQEEIERLAAAHTQKQTGLELGLTDPGRYQIMRSFTEIRVNPWHTKREWQLYFEPLTLDAPYVSLVMTPQGEVLDYSDNLDYVRSPLPQDKAERLMAFYNSRYSDTYGSKDGWSQENWQQLRASLLELNLDDDEQRRDIQEVLRQGYTPPEKAIPKEEAVKLAAAAVAGRYQVDEAELLDTGTGRLPAASLVYAIYLEYGDIRHYKVSFANRYLAEIDALTGKVMIVDAYSPGNYHNRRYVLDDLLPYAQRAYASPRPTADPALMEDDTRPMAFVQTDLNLAPAWFWEALQGLNYSAKTAAGIYNRLSRDYGDGDRYWPILYQAMDYMRNFRQGTRPGDIFPGLPKDTDLEQEAAVKLALDAAADAAKAKGKDLPEGLRPIVYFTFNLYGRDSRTWQIDLVDLGEPPVEIQPLTDFAYVKIDAITGKVIEVTLPDFNEEAAPANRALDLSGSWSDLGADGRPLIWGNPVAPEAFWAYMAAHYGDRDTVAQAITEWTALLGGDTNFWPVEQRAAAALWLGHPHVTEETLAYLSILGLPQDEHVQQQKAEELAWEALKAAAGSQYNGEDYGSVRLKVGFFYDAAYPNGCAWQLEFMDGRTAYETTISDVTLDGLTGEVLNVTVGTGHG